MDLFPQSGGIFQFGPVNERIRLGPCLEGGGIPAHQVARPEDEGGQRSSGKRVIEKSCRLHGIHNTPLFRLQCGNGRFRLALVVRRPFINIRKGVFFLIGRMTGLLGPDLNIRQILRAALVRQPLSFRILPQKSREIRLVTVDDPSTSVQALSITSPNPVIVRVFSHERLNLSGFVVVKVAEVFAVAAGIILFRAHFRGKQMGIALIRPEHPLQPLLALSAEDRIGQRRVTELDIEQADLLHDIGSVLQIDGIAHLVGRPCVRDRFGVGFLRRLHDPLGLGAV